MSNELDIIRALVELGDKATPGTWKAAPRHVDVDDARMVAPDEFLQCHIERKPSDADECDPDEDIEGAIAVPSHPDEHPARRGSFLCVDAAFCALAANARPALRAMLARLEKLEGALKEIATHDHGSPERYEGSNTGDAETYGYDLASHALGSIAAAALKEAQDA